MQTQHSLEFYWNVMRLTWLHLKLFTIRWCAGLQLEYIVSLLFIDNYSIWQMSGVLQLLLSLYRPICILNFYTISWNKPVCESNLSLYKHAACYMDICHDTICLYLFLKSKSQLWNRLHLYQMWVPYTELYERVTVVWVITEMLVVMLTSIVCQMLSWQTKK